MIFPIISGVILLIAVGIFISKTDKKEVKPEEVIPKEKQPVLIEMIPKGTSANPFVCKVNTEVPLEVKGYADYSKKNEVALNGGHISWHKSCPVGRFDKLYGVKNIYYTPSVKGTRDLWCKYNDGKLRTSANLKVLVEV